MAQLISTKKAHRMIQHYKSKCEGDIEEIQGLNITAMMDMMTILLVFLLKSFAVTTGLITPSEEDLKLPKSIVTSQPSDFLVVTVTRQAILVEGESVVDLFGGKVHSSAKQTAQSLEIKELKDALNIIGQFNEHKAKSGGRPFERQFLLVADKDTPYQLISSIILTASAAKFLKFQLVVISTTAG